MRLSHCVGRARGVCVPKLNGLNSSAIPSESLRPCGLCRAEVSIMQLEEHPTVRRLANQVQQVENTQEPDTMLESAWLRHLAVDCGADDAGLVDITRPALDAQRAEILRNYPWTKSLLSFVVRMAREPVRGAPRSMRSAQRLWPSLRRAASEP